MGLQGQAQRGIVVADLLAEPHRRQAHLGIGSAFADPGEQRQFLRPQRAHRPQRLTPRTSGRAVCVGSGQRFHRADRQARATPQITGIGEWPAGVLPLGHDRLGAGFGKPLDLAKPEPQGVAAPVVLLQRAVPAAVVDVDGARLDAVIAGVAHQLGRGVESHGLAVEDRGREHIRVVAFQPGRDIDQQGEAGGVGFREAVFAEPFDLIEAALGEFRFVAVGDHAGDQLLAEGMNGAGAAEGGHGAAQIVGLRRREAGRDDGDLHGLFLEQRYAERLGEHRPQRVRGVLDPLLAAAAAQIGVHHVALDRAGPDDRHLDHQIVKIARAQARQHGHLGAALDLEDADRIRFAQHVVDRRVLGRHGGEVDRAAVMGGQQVERLADAGQHAEAQHVDLQDPQRIQVILVPFDGGAVLHGGVGDGHDLRQRPARDHEAAHMLGQMAREAGQLARQLDRHAQARLGRVEADFADMFLVDAVGAPAPYRAGQRRDRVGRQRQRLADLADRHARAIVDHGRGEAGALAAVLAVDVLDHLLAALMLEIDVDVGRFAALGRDEALEQQIHAARIDGGDAEAVAHRRVRRRAAPLAEDAA